MNLTRHAIMLMNHAAGSMRLRRKGLRLMPGLRQRVCCLLLLLAAPLLLAWAPAVGDPGPPLRLTDAAAAGLSSDAPPRTIGRVVDLVDASSGQTLSAVAAREKHAIGSITKLMTGLLAIRHLDLNRVVTVTRKAASTYGSTMWLYPGDRVTVRALLYGLLIPSGNDAAEQLAETMSGNDRYFARLMNLQAKRFGLSCSHYVTPHGLDARGQYSCASDVARISIRILHQPLLARIVSTRHVRVYGVGGTPTFNLQSTDRLLQSYRGAIGVKTGTTNAAGASLSSAARRNGHTVIAVVLGSTELGRFSDAAALLNFAYKDYVWPSTKQDMWSTRSLEGLSPSRAVPLPRWEQSWLTDGSDPSGVLVDPR